MGGRNKTGKTVWLVLAAACMCAASAVLFLINGYVEEEYRYGRTEEVFYNPLMGFAVNADYPDAVAENTLVYVDITWREWEPEEGVYAVEAVKAGNFWDRWKQEGKKAVLRFVCDIPSGEAHMDIPDWLYDKTGDGVFYDHDYGRGYAPEYGNRVMIEAHQKAIAALGEAFGQDSMVAYVQLGSLGHWGEWHTLYTAGVPRMPASRIREEYVLPCLEAFPGARLLARRPFPETAALGSGLYNDMTGDPPEMDRWLSWMKEGGVYAHPAVEEELTPQPDVWRTAPVGGEFTSGLPYDEMLRSELDRTLSLIQQSHMTFIGPKCPVREETVEYAEGVNRLLRTIGYRYGISRCEVRRPRWGDTGEFTLTVENYGAAPIYFPWRMYLYVYGEDGEELERRLVPVELMSLCGGEATAVTLSKIPMERSVLSPGTQYSYGVAIEDPDTGEPAVFLDMDCEKKDRIYYLTKQQSGK